MELLLTTVADFLVRQSWQVAVVFLLVAAACWGLRKASAHWRYLLWLVVLAKCLVPGLVSVPLAVLPHQAPSQPMPPRATPAMLPATGTAVAPAEMAAEQSALGVAPALPRQPEALAPPDNQETTTVSSSAWQPQQWLAIVWLAGVGLFLIYVLVRAWVTHRRLRRLRRWADPEIEAMVAALALRLGLKRSPTVYTVNAVAQPFVWGWLRGSIYLPEQFASTGSPQQQEAILTHELAHVARWDAAVNLVQILVQAVFFFHPLVWWTNRQIRQEREKCCDEIVIARLDANPRQYGQAIVNALVAEYEGSQPSPSLAVAGRLRNIEDRIQTILNPDRKFYRRPSGIAVAATLLLAVCVVPAALVLTARGNGAEPPASGAITKDWQPGQTLELQALNAQTKEPLPGVKLDLQFAGKGINFLDVKTQTTDAQGRSTIRLPDLRPDAVRIYPSKAGFVPLRVYWGDDLPEPKLPKSVTVSMEPGVVWGGIVQNEQGEPIPNVQVKLHYWGSSSSFNPHLRVNIDDDIEGVTTDKDGRWRMDILPAKFTDEGPKLFLTHPDYVSDHLHRGYTPRPVTERPSYEALRAQTAVMVLRKGVTIEGRVTDAAGKPIPGASVCHQEECYWEGSHKIAATTDETGHFRLTGLNNIPETNNPGLTQTVLTVEAPGYSPELVEASLSGATRPLAISLKPGQAIQGEVVDENGKPVPDATITLDLWKGHLRRLCKKVVTDAAGKFRLEDAPAEPTEYDIEKKGRITVRKSLPPSSEAYRITLRPPVRISGSIVDAATNQPLAKCQLTKGWDPEDGRGPQWETAIGFPTKAITNGRYEIKLTQESRAVRVRIEAEGYQPVVSRLFKPYAPDQGQVTYDFKLSKAVPLTGTVLGSDNAPLAGAEVILAKQTLAVNQSKISSFDRRVNPYATTDAAGRFTLPSESEPFYLVVLHEQGRAILTESQLAATPTIRLEPWTAENRTFRVDRSPVLHPPQQATTTDRTFTVRIVDEQGQPVEGARVCASLEFRPARNEFRPEESCWNYFPDLTSDREGLARLPAENHIVCVVARHVERKLIGIESLSPEQKGAADVITLTMHPQCTVSGQLTATELETRGRKLTWSNVYVHLDKGWGRPMGCMSEKGDYRFYLPPGTFTLEAYATDTQYVRKTITVPPGQDQLEVEPIDLPPTGLVRLEGKPAPELRDVVGWKNGGPTTLADLRGKVVILTFSSGWSGERGHSIVPYLFPLYEKYHEQGLVILEIRFDLDLPTVPRTRLQEKLAKVQPPFWKEGDYPVPIALVSMDRGPRRLDAPVKNPGTILQDYGFNNVPSCVLIDRQGRVAGRFIPQVKADQAKLEKLLQEK